MAFILIATALYAKLPLAQKIPSIALIAFIKNRKSRKVNASKKRSFDEIKSTDQQHIDEGEDNNSNNNNNNNNNNSVTLKWSNVTMTVKQKKKKQTIDVLANVSGYAREGKLLAIVGPSGSGKTSLLNALSQRVKNKQIASLQGEIYKNGHRVREDLSKSKDVEYVEQEDVFFAQLSVRETLAFAVELARSKRALSKDDSDETNEDICDRLLIDLGLTKCAETKIGDQKTRGISGGEKKRLSLACHLVSNPRLIFLDEPTSGLDSYQAFRVIKALKKLCEEKNATVICSIHQPRQKIVDLFDDVSVLSQGKLMYHGPIRDLKSTFSRIGFECPKEYNILEYVIDLISIDASSDDTIMESEKTIAKISAMNTTTTTTDNNNKNDSEAAAITTRIDDEIKNDDDDNNNNQIIASFFRQFPLLFKRAFKQVTRDGPTNKIRLTANVNSALVFGSIFWQLTLSPASMQNRFGLLQVSTINTAMAALMKTLTAFTKEKTIVERERANGAYGILPFFCAKIFAELPISAMFPLAFGCVVYPMTRLQPTVPKFARFCGAIVMESFCASAMGMAISSVAPSTEAALAMGPGIMVLFIVFGGYYVNVETVPKYFRWINRCSLIREGFQSLCCNEFSGLQFSPGPSGEKALENLGFDAKNGYGESINGLANTLGYLWLLTLYLLDSSAPTFAPMTSPSAASIRI